MQPPSEQVIYEFSDFRLDPARRLLTRNGETILLHPRALDLLVTLIENQGRVLSKNELLDRVWSGQFVEENNLAVQIFALRKIFGETKNDHRFIVTVPGKGYKFVAEIQNGYPDRDVHPLLANGNGHASRENAIDDAAIAQLRAPTQAPPAGNSLFDSFLAKQSRLVMVAFLCVIALGLVAYIAFRQGLSDGRLAAGESNQIKVRQLTTKGRVGLTAISPNSEFYAYTIDVVGEQKRSFWIGQLNSGKSIELRPPDDNLLRGVAFSPDSKALYFTLADSVDSEGGFFSIPILGGIETKIAAEPRGAFSLSPDGTQVSYRKKSQTGDGSALVIANLDGSGARELINRTPERPLVSRAPAWSPDGSMIAVSAVADDVTHTEEIFVVQVDNGQTEQLTSLGWNLVQDVVWSPSGRELIAVAVDSRETLRHLWRIDYPTGKASRLSSDTSDYGPSLSISSDGKSVLAVQVNSEGNIWIAPSEDPARARQISFSSINGAFGWYAVDWTPDGRIVFDAGVERNKAIFIMSAEGRDIRQITSTGFFDHSATISPDGRTVVFCSNRSGTNELWRVNLDGTDLRHISRGGGCSSPDITPDGSEIIYVLNRSGRETIWRVPIDGGEPVQVTTNESFDPKVSPDGSFIACGYRSDEKSGPKLAVLDRRNGALLKTFQMPRSTNFNGGINWTPDGKSITIRDWANGIWKQDIAGGPPTAIEGLPHEKLYGYDWSPDGKMFAFSRGRAIADAVLINLE